ncbi:putative CytH-like phosphatase [Aeromonas phage ZPAH34]|uniref:putative CytH-like phosphatase n=1 Tax=Aeromonas phage ZPAH34 TaxID=2924888 RepID=UPI0023299B2F|nr:putative CytH-like phosphatase [Aeromonas phage ZPAH34]UOX39536.1 putative CytH-like phosphatase [Aeromonas phage ZPAH34]
MISNNKDWFVYSSYWRTWSRVLQRMGGAFHTQIEIDITPINPDLDRSWLAIPKVNIREHCTISREGDIWTHHLPDDVVKTLEARVSKSQLDLILHEDLLPMINVKEFSKAGHSLILLEVVKPEHKALIKQLINK